MVVQAQGQDRGRHTRERVSRVSAAGGGGGKGLKGLRGGCLIAVAVRQWWVGALTVWVRLRLNV